MDYHGEEGAVLGWIGNLFIIAGLWGVGNRSRRAFLFSVVGEACWISNATARRDWALASICVVFAVMAIRGYIKWGAQ